MANTIDSFKVSDNMNNREVEAEILSSKSVQTFGEGKIAREFGAL